MLYIDTIHYSVRDNGDYSQIGGVRNFWYQYRRQKRSFVYLGGISISDFLYRVIRLFPYDNIQHGIGIGIGMGISKLIFDGVHQIVDEIHRTIAVKKQKAERSHSPY